MPVIASNVHGSWKREHKGHAGTILPLVIVGIGSAGRGCGPGQQVPGFQAGLECARHRALCAALGLILAGTLGNLYDRLIFDGVRDFLYFHWFEWPVFNFADCCLVSGACLLLLQAFLTHPVKQPQESKEMVLSASS